MTNHFVFGMKSAEVKELEAEGLSKLKFSSATTNPWNQLEPGSRISIYLADKGTYACQVEALGGAELGSTMGELKIRKIVAVPEKDYVAWKSMQDNLDYLRPFPPPSWGENSLGQLRKISEKDSKVILRSLEMVLTCPKPEKPAPKPAAAAPAPA